MMEWCITYIIRRFQICPRVAKELEAGHAVTRNAATKTQDNSRCFWDS